MAEVDRKLQDRFATFSQIVATLGEQHGAAPQASQPAADFGKFNIEAINMKAEIASVKTKLSQTPDYSKNMQDHFNQNAAALAALRAKASDAHAGFRAEASAAHAGLRAEASTAHAALRWELMTVIASASPVPPVGHQSGPAREMVHGKHLVGPSVEEVEVQGI